MNTTRDNYALTAGGIAEGTNANTFKTTYAITAEIEGRAVYKAPTDNIAYAAFTGTSITALAARQTCAFFYMMNAAGAITAIQSSIKPSTLSASYQPGVWEWPDREGFVCIGATVIRTDGTATFTAGSTDLGASDVVDTHIDAVGSVTSRPIAY
jgi:hypothetical protein